MLDRYHRPALMSLLLLAFYLRTGVGLMWDDSQHLHPDERFLSMVADKLKPPESSAAFFDSSTSSMNPYNMGYHFYVYGTLPILLTKYIALSLGIDDYAHFFIVGRILSSVFDLITLWTVYCLGRLVFAPRVGLAAAALHAVVPQNIQLSHFFGVENFAACFLTLAFLLALGIVTPAPARPPPLHLQRMPMWCLTAALLAVLLRLGGGLPWYAVMQIEGILVCIIFSFACHRECGWMARCSVIGLLLGMALASKISTAFALPFVALPLVSLALRTRRSGTGTLAPDQVGTQPPTLPCILAGALLAIAMTVLCFRVYQPYAFGGTTLLNFSLSEVFKANMAEIKGLMDGADSPPNIYWVGREPLFFHWRNMFYWQMGAMWFILAWSGVLVLGAKTVLRPDITLLPWLLWTVFWFGYSTLQFVKAGRYLSTIYPFFALAAGYTVIYASKQFRLWWTNPFSLRTFPTFVSALPVLIVVGYSLAFALGITNIYRLPHTRIEASRWIYANIPCGATLANEHWDDGLPLRVDGKDGFHACYKGLEFKHYHLDRPDKLEETMATLLAADYIVISSNRLTSSIPRMPRRFPFTIEYYRMLFSGELGFALVKIFSSYPHLGPFFLKDDDLEEMLLNYDHPKVLIFRKTGNFNPDAIRERLESFPSAVPVTLIEQQE